MTVVGFVTDPMCLEHEWPGHPERPERLRAILAHLDGTGLRNRMVELTPRDAAPEEVLAVHRRSVIETQLELASTGGGWVDPDTYVRPDSPAVARRSAGATLRALEAVLGGEVTRAFAAVRPPGHHATARSMMGFCLLNNVAICVAAARRLGIRRVAVIDWDVHHGNGTQAIFDDDPDVLYVSTHAAPFYPGTGAVSDSGRGAARGTKVNIPLPFGTGDAGFMAAYDQVVIPVVERFGPQLVIISCGWDAHARDPLGPLQLSTSGYSWMAARVRDAADTLAGGRLVVALEGGYDEHALAWCAGGLCEVLLGQSPTPDPEPVQSQREPDIGAVLAASCRELGLP